MLISIYALGMTTEQWTPRWPSLKMSSMPRVRYIFPFNDKKMWLEISFNLGICAMPSPSPSSISHNACLFVWQWSNLKADNLETCLTHQTSWKSFRVASPICINSCVILGVTVWRTRKMLQKGGFRELLRFYLCWLPWAHSSQMLSQLSIAVNP